MEKDRQKLDLWLRDYKLKLKYLQNPPALVESRRNLSQEQRHATLLYVDSDKHRLLHLVDEKGVDKNMVLRKAPFSGPALRIKSPGVCTEMVWNDDSEHLMLWYDTLERLDVRSAVDGQLIKSFEGFADCLFFADGLCVGLKEGNVKLVCLEDGSWKEQTTKTSLNKDARLRKSDSPLCFHVVSEKTAQIFVIKRNDSPLCFHVVDENMTQVFSTKRNDGSPSLQDCVPLQVVNESIKESGDCQARDGKTTLQELPDELGPIAAARVAQVCRRFNTLIRASSVLKRFCLWNNIAPKKPDFSDALQKLSEATWDDADDLSSHIMKSLGSLMATHPPTGRYIFRRLDGNALLKRDGKLERYLEEGCTDTRMAAFLDDGKTIVFQTLYPPYGDDESLVFLDTETGQERRRRPGLVSTKQMIVSNGAIHEIRVNPQESGEWRHVECFFYSLQGFRLLWRWPLRFHYLAEVRHRRLSDDMNIVLCAHSRAHWIFSLELHDLATILEYESGEQFCVKSRPVPVTGAYIFESLGMFALTYELDGLLELRQLQDGTEVVKFEDVFVVEKLNETCLVGVSKNTVKLLYFFAGAWHLLAVPWHVRTDDLRLSREVSVRVFGPQLFTVTVRRSFGDRKKFQRLFFLEHGQPPSLTSFCTCGTGDSGPLCRKPNEAEPHAVYLCLGDD